MELSYEELERLIREINQGQKITYVDDVSGRSIPLLFRHPSPRDRELARLVYDEAYKEAERMELPSIEDMEKTIESRGLISKEEEEELKKLKSRLEGQRLLLAKTTRVPSRKKRIKDIISDMEEKIAEIQFKKERSLEFTKERKSTEQKFLYLTWRGVLNPHKESRYWLEYSEFLGEKDFVFRKKTFIEYIIFSNGIGTKTLRYIARSNLWRVRFVTAVKTGDNLFGRPINEYTTDQLMLTYWSNFYQSVYDMLSDEKPPDNIIEDDEALDAYMKDWQAERSRHTAEARAKKNNKLGNPSAWDYNEVLVTKSNEMYEDIEYSETMAQKARYKDQVSHDAAPISRSKKKR